MIKLPTPETKWYVTEYPNECDFAVTDGNEILVTIIGGNTIGDQCDLASRIAKLPDLESECEEAIDRYKSLQKTFEEWQLKFLSEQVELLHNKDVQNDKLFDEAYQIRIERDEARETAEKWKKLHDAKDELFKKGIAEVERERDEAREEAGHWKTEYEIVVDRLRGRKHPRDNGIIADDEIIPKLERERNEARAELTNLESLMFGGLVQPAPKNALAWRVFDAVMAMKKERDEAREELKEIAEYGTEEINAAVELRQKLASALIERDEAREAIKIVAQHKDKMIEQVIVERDSAREAFGNQKARIGEFFSALEKLTAERDEARQDAKHWEELYRTVSTY